VTARIGRKTPAAQPLPESVWRKQVRTLAYWLLMALMGLSWLALLLLATQA
jgi:hypothetical protein